VAFVTRCFVSEFFEPIAKLRVRAKDLRTDLFLNIFSKMPTTSTQRIAIPRIVGDINSLAVAMST
jgi:hypothetical protein